MGFVPKFPVFNDGGLQKVWTSQEQVKLLQGSLKQAQLTAGKEAKRSRLWSSLPGLVQFQTFSGLCATGAPDVIPSYDLVVVHSTE